MISKSKLTGILLLLITLMSVSCNDKEESFDSITLSYAAYGPIFDNQAKLISIPLLNESLPIQINGGDGHYGITNNSESIIVYTFDERILTIHAISPGTGSITIKDNSHNSYTLEISVFSNEIPTTQVSSYAIVRGLDMDVIRKATLENKIINDAPTGVWQFGSTYINVGVPFIARQYITNAEGSDYREYTATLLDKVPQDQIPLPLVTVACCFTMKSDTEEFVLYICQPFELDNGKFVRGYTWVRNVTSRYIVEYPEITSAFEVQSYLNQNY